ncbi:MAG: hypothetical protein IT578_04200, partial [Verrucomicrobiae bacterium]|nr:hypothetical protein [Verrucomicrobiae bacterium]
MADDLQLDFVGKTVARVMCRPDARGLCRDLLLRFSDGTEVQIGATREG